MMYVPSNFQSNKSLHSIGGALTIFFNSISSRFEVQIYDKLNKSIHKNNCFQKMKKKRGIERDT